MSLPPYRIPIQRLKEDWASRVAWRSLRRRRPASAPSFITDNSEPWIRNPSSVAEFWEIACHVNKTVSRWAARKKTANASAPSPPSASPAR